MNENDDRNQYDGDSSTPSGSGDTPEQKLAGRIEAVLAVLNEARAEAGKAGPGARLRLVAAYRERFTAVMTAFSEALADVLAFAPGAFAPSAGSSGLLAPLLGMSRDVPLFRRAEQTVVDEKEDLDLQRILLTGRGAGFDLPSLLLEDYYQGTVFVRTLRSRVTVLGEMLRDEICTRVRGGQDVVHLLNLRCGGLLELEPLLEHPLCSAHTAITFVDSNTAALRITRQKVERRLAHRPSFLRADPLTVGQGINRPRRSFDLALTFSRFDILPQADALNLTGNCYTFLKPGGALMTTGYLPSVPRGEKALALGLLGAQVNFWDEQAWRNLLQGASFDAEKTRFERRPPAAIALSAPRG